MPLSFLCITISLAALLGAQQALEVSQMGRAVETGASSSNGHSKERMWNTWGTPLHGLIAGDRGTSLTQEHSESPSWPLCPGTHNDLTGAVVPLLDLLPRRLRPGKVNPSPSLAPEDILAHKSQWGQGVNESSGRLLCFWADTHHCLAFASNVYFHIPFLPSGSLVPNASSWSLELLCQDVPLLVAADPHPSCFLSPPVAPPQPVTSPGCHVPALPILSCSAPVLSSCLYSSTHLQHISRPSPAVCFQLWSNFPVWFLALRLDISDSTNRGTIPRLWGTGSTGRATQSHRPATWWAHGPRVVPAVPSRGTNAVSHCQHLFMPGLDSLVLILTEALFSGHQMSFELFYWDVPKAPTFFKTNSALSCWATDPFWPVGNTAAWKEQRLWGEAGTTSA